MQEGMVLESVLAERAGLNVEQVVARLDEGLDLEAFAFAWAALIKRHDILRASFSWDPTPALHLERTVAFTPTVQDWRGTPADAQEARLAAFLVEDRALGVDLAAPPAMRLTLAQVGEARWLMVWTFHHAILDGRSFTMALEEVFETYDATLAGAPPERPAMRPFQDHVAAARDLDLSAARRFFVSHLGDFDEPLQLPIARPDPTPATARHVDVDQRVAERDVVALERLAADCEVTLYTVLVSAWALVLCRYTGRDAVVFGSTRSGRHTVPEAASMLGCMINTVPLRLDLDPDEPVETLLRRARAALLDVRPYEQTPLRLIHEWSNVPSGRSMLTTNVVFESYLMNARLRAKGGAWDRRSFEVHEEGSFPLSLAAYLDGSLLLRLEHDPTLYPEEAVRRMAGHVAHALKSIVQLGADGRVGDLEMLRPEEAEALRRAGRPERPVPQPEPEVTYLDLFERAVERGPDAIAVSQRGQPPLTYAQLLTRAYQLAHTLRRHGVDPEIRVAICLPRQPDIAVAILAVLAAGGAYVSIDPRYPKDAIAHVLTDSGASVVLTTRALAAALPRSDAGSGARAPTIHLDEVEWSDSPTTAPDRGDLKSDNLAYIVYTSGSTGKPKGVMITHGCVVSHALATASAMELTEDDRVLQFASFSFDVSVEETLPPWHAGSHVILRTDAHVASMADFLELLDEPPAPTVLNLPTAFWHTLVSYLDDSGARLPERVRLVVVGGEKASPAAYETWRKLDRGVRWINAYGPSETTVTCTTYEPSAVDASARRDLPIGRPTGNAEVYVLGPHRELLPIGIPGELWIGGPCVARGYLGRPDLDRGRFEPNWLTGEGRIYRSGDRVRWGTNGRDLDFLGRTDRQLKIRGFRIEPGEVESVIAQLREVEQVFVDQRGDELVAWVVARAETPTAARALADRIRAEVKTRLPPQMTPSAVAVLDAFPVKPGGKINTAALETPRVAADRETLAPPATALEAKIAGIFADVLGREAVGVDQSFYDLGGHSLLALRLLAGLEQATGRRLGGAVLATAHTPQQLAAVLESEADIWECIVPIQPDGARIPIFGVHVLGERGSYFRPLAERLGADQPVFGLTVPPREVVPSRVPDVAALYADELVRFRPTGPFVLTAVSLGSMVAFELAHQLRARGREVALLGFFDALGPDGMESVGPRQRAIHHARRLRRGGVRYLREKVTARASHLRTQLEALAVRAITKTGLPLPEQLRMSQHIEQNIAAAGEYRPARWPGDIIIFRAVEDVFYTDSFHRSGLGWGPYVEGKVRMIDVPGDHLGMLAEPAVRRLAEAIERLLPTDAA